MGKAAARRQGVSIGIAAGAYGISFGALAVTAGLQVWQACALSLLMFTSASEFSFIGVMSSGGSPVAAIATSALVGIRHASYGALLAPYLRPLRGWRLFLAAQVTLDESAAAALARHHHKSGRAGFWAAGISVYVTWNIATLAGALAGARIGHPTAWGLDAAAPAAFLGLLWTHLEKPNAKVAAVVAVGATLALTPVLPAGVAMLAAALLAVIAGEAVRQRPEGSDATEAPLTGVRP
jgi:predicted branched-subunit amino acid permease